jgi:hypothetical protein
MMMTKQQLQRAVVAVAIGVSGAIVGANISTTNVAHGEVRGTPEPPAFQRGDQIAVPILRDIAATLHQMDTRLAKLEMVAQKVQTSPARAVEIENPSESN